MKYFIFCFLLLAGFANSQILKKLDSLKEKSKDTLVIDSGKKDSLKIFIPTIADYLYQTQFSDKKILDTTFTQNKTYIYSQYNNKDNFGNIQFANVGSGFNPMVYSFNEESNFSLLPHNKAYIIKTIAEIKYYDVKTPTTTFYYHTGVKNGGVLQTTYTQNIGKNFNFALEYMGLRSLGQYQNALSVNNNTIFSGHYKSSNQKYEAFAHFIHQNINNEENGGIADLDEFSSNNTASNDRNNLLVNLDNSESRFSYRRYYLSHQFSPFNSKSFPFKIRHTISHQANKYYYSQNSVESYYSLNDVTSLASYPLSSGKFSKNLSNTVSILFDNEKFKLDAGLRHQTIKFGLSNPLITSSINITNQLSENRIGAIGNLKINLWDKLDLKSTLEFSEGKEFGTFFKSNNSISIEPIKDYFLNAKVNLQSAAPSFNYLMNASIYNKFNYNFTQFKNENRLEIGGSLGLKWYKTELFANYFRVDQFSYFDDAAMPQQSSSSVNIAQFGGDTTFNYKKFYLNTRLLYQNTLTNKDLFPAPNLVARMNIFYQSKAFKNAAEIQTGIKVNYFSKFNSREFFPVLNEFILPGTSAISIGGEPIVDVYFNMKVKRMFIFVEGQHLNTLLSTNNTFVAPLYPYQDFRLNIGIVWYLIN